MAQYGKLSGTVQLANGNADSGATVEIRSQGAFVTSTQAGPTYTVNDPGGIETTNQVRVNTLTGPTRQVTAVTATTLTTGGAGLGTLVNNDRITVQSPLPILYADAQGAETKTNPVTTNASGYWFAWVPIVPYDIIITKSDGSGVVLKTDVVPEGQESVLSNIFTGGAAIAWLRNTLRTLTSGYLLKIQNDGTDKLTLAYDGQLTLAGNLSGTDATFSGSVSVSGDITVTDDIGCDDLTCNDATVSNAFTYSGTTGNFSLTAGSIETADLAANAVCITQVGTGTADQAITTGAYPTWTDIPNATVTTGTLATTDELVITATVTFLKTGAAGTNFVMAIRDGTTIIAEAMLTDQSAGANSYMSVSCRARLTGLNTAKTYKVSCGSSVAAGTVQDSTAPTRATTIIVERHRK